MFKNNLREIRFFKNIPQIRLAQQTGIHFSTLSRIENGWTHGTPEQRRKLARTLRVRISDLFPRDENEDAKPIHKKRIKPVL